MRKHFAIAVLVIAVGLTGHTEARTKFYKTNTDLPFVEMMLGMMVAMGILDKIPPEFMGYGAYPASPWPNQNFGNKYQLQQYLLSRNYGNRYRGKNYPGAGLYSQYPGLYGMNSSPFSQNPMLGFPGRSPFNRPALAPRHNNEHLFSNDDWLPMRPSTCVGGSCLSQQHKTLNGLWISEDGEMMGINNDQFLWSNGQDSYITGLMNIDEDTVVASIDGSDRQITYQYRVQGNELLTKDANGVVRRFWRYPSVPVGAW